jgi:hypothetical protein
MKQKKTLPITVKVTKDHDGQVTEFREQRGIRDERFAIGDSPFSSAYGKFGEMVAGAESLLREAGETTGVEAMDGFLGSERNKALVDWSTGVMLRNGSTTPVGCAVSFLFAAHILTLKLNDGATQRSTDLFHLILEFCSAWHWLHMELYGEHD